MSNRTYFFPEFTREDFPGIHFIELPKVIEFRWPDDPKCEFTFTGFDSSPAKYPASVLADLLEAGEITREQHERLRREKA